MIDVVLASSPLVGASALGRLEERLSADGSSVRCPAVPFDLTEFVASVAAQVRSDSVLVGFSAAGPRLFATAAAVGPKALVFLDARLPADGVAPDDEPAFRDLLDGLPLAEDGTLPPWPTWWPPDVVSTLVPDPDDRAALVASSPRLPRATFSAPIPAPAVDVPCGFVALGDGYESDATEAERRGWPVVRLAGAHHLWPIVEPGAVAEAIVEVAGRLT